MVATPYPGFRNTDGGPTAFKLRSARRGDTDALSALIGELGYPEGVDPATLHWVVSHPEIEIIVAVDSTDRPMGMITLSHRPQLRLKGRVATIDELVVATRWRRKGVAKSLIKRAMERSKVLGAKRLELHGHGATTDPGVVLFAKACGFTQTDASAFSQIP